MMMRRLSPHGVVTFGLSEQALSAGVMVVTFSKAPYASENARNPWSPYAPPFEHLFRTQSEENVEQNACGRPRNHAARKKLRRRASPDPPKGYPRI
jgi:hypothetical protein